MPRQRRYSKELLTRTAAESESLVDLMRRLDAPLCSGPYQYLRRRLRHYGIDTSHFRDEALPPRVRREYSRETLAEAAAACTSVPQILEYMGVPPYPSAHSYLGKRLRHYGIDTSHFRREGSHALAGIPHALLAETVARSLGYAEVLRLLGLTDNGSSRRWLKGEIARHQLPIGHFVGQARGKGTPSPTRKRAAEILQRRGPGQVRTKTPLLRRALAERGVPEQCAQCGTGTIWRGKRLVLEVDHINGDPARQPTGEPSIPLPLVPQPDDDFRPWDPISIANLDAITVVWTLLTRPYANWLERLPLGGSVCRFESGRAYR